MTAKTEETPAEAAPKPKKGRKKVGEKTPSKNAAPDKQEETKMSNNDISIILSQLSDEERQEMIQAHHIKSIYQEMWQRLHALNITPEQEDGENPLIILTHDGFAWYETDDDDDDDDEDEDEDISTEKPAIKKPKKPRKQPKGDSNIIERLKHYMSDKDRSQGWASEKFEVSQATVSNWLTGKSIPRGDKAKRIESFIGAVNRRSTVKY